MRFVLPLPPSANRYMFDFIMFSGIMKRVERTLARSFNSSQITFNRGESNVDSINIPRASGVYLITNKINQYFYVGSTVDFKHRWGLHLSDLKRQKHHNPRLQAAWNKYGEDSFEFSIIEFCPKENLLEVEQKWLDSYNVGNRRDCYNFCTKAYSHLGRKRSAETKRRLSESQKGKTTSPEAKAKMRAAKIGKKLTAEHIEKCRIASTGRTYSRTEQWKAQYRKLSVEQIVSFRALRKSGWTLGQLAEHFGIGESTAMRIIKGQSYVGVGA